MWENQLIETFFGKVDEIKIGVKDIIFSPNNFVSHKVSLYNYVDKTR